MPRHGKKHKTAQAVTEGTTSLPPAAGPQNPILPQGQQERYDDPEVRGAIDDVIKEQRVSFVTIARGKIVVRAIDEIPDGAVEQRLRDVLTLLRLAAPDSPQILQAMSETDGLVLLAE